LPLSVVVIAGLLGKMDPTHDNWKKVEENLNSFFGTVSERCQSILSLSYSYLPQYLRACFLYVGGFPEDSAIDVSKLIRLWIAEQFVRERSNKRIELVAEEYLEELIGRSLLLVGTLGDNGRMRSCKIHDLLRQLCIKEAHTENVVHVMNGNVPVSSEAIDDQRRVILSECREAYVYGTRHSNCITSITRTFISMLTYCPEGMIHSIVSHFKLLKVLDVSSMNYDFSLVIPQLVHLRYVDARINEALSLARLRNLQTIILQSYEVTELPEEHPLSLNDLQTLSLWDSPFAAEIIRRTPNLKELKIVHKSKHPDWPAILDSLSLLEELETLVIETEQTIDPLIDDCTPTVETSSKKIQEEQQSSGNYELQVRIDCITEEEFIEGIMKWMNEPIELSRRCL
ncbi:hypothetical protein HAX54_019655, partial [Datura stramonium]|nr:hypothetical protein [Datura stramonium]